MKIPPQSTLSGFFEKKIQEFDEWIVEVFEPFFEFWPSVPWCSMERRHLLKRKDVWLILNTFPKNFWNKKFL